jgi:hypothetical protein
MLCFTTCGPEQRFSPFLALPMAMEPSLRLPRASLALPCKLLVDSKVGTPRFAKKY